jgi:hypothetical protein
MILFLFLAQDGLQWNTVYTMRKWIHPLTNNKANGQTHESSLNKVIQLNVLSHSEPHLIFILIFIAH